MAALLFHHCCSTLWYLCSRLRDPLPGRQQGPLQSARIVLVPLTLFHSLKKPDSPWENQWTRFWYCCSSALLQGWSRILGPLFTEWQNVLCSWLYCYWRRKEGCTSCVFGFRGCTGLRHCTGQYILLIWDDVFLPMTARSFWGVFPLYSQWIKNLQDNRERRLSKYVLKTTSFFFFVSTWIHVGCVCKIF